MSNSDQTPEALLALAKQSRKVGKILLWGLPFDVAMTYMIANIQTSMTVSSMTLILLISMSALIIPIIIYSFKRAEKYELLAKQAREKY